MVRLCGLWKHEGAKGNYLTGKMGSARFVVLKNEHRNKDTDPEFLLYVKNDEKDHSVE